MTRALLVLAAAAAIIGFGATPGLAQTRVFVSGSGSDANNCSLSAPCRSFQHAHDTVVAGGEVVALDAAGYGTVTISKAVTITAIGIEASITSNNTTPTGITINAGASDTVAIRGITVISGSTTPSDGIDINSGKSVTITDTSVSGFPSFGVNVIPTGGTIDVELRDLAISGNGATGLQIGGLGSAVVTALVTNTSVGGSGGNGVAVSGGISNNIKATLSLTSSNNGGGGLLVATTGAQPVVMVTSSKLVNNSVQGLSAAGNVKVLVDRTQISGNGTNGWEAVAGAVVNSYKNNEVNGNGNDGFNGVVQITQQ